MASVEHVTALERELLASIAGGDAGALTALYERMRAPLLAYLILLVRDNGVAEEVLQDTILAVWRGAGRFRDESSVRSWVFAIARRRAIDRLRSMHDRLENDEQLTLRVDDRPGPEELAISSATQAEIETAIRASTHSSGSAHAALCLRALLRRAVIRSFRSARHREKPHQQRPQSVTTRA